MSIAVILGTSRVNGNTHGLADEFCSNVPSDLFVLKNYSISEYDYEHKNIDDDFFPLVDELLKYDHWVYATPVYWYSMSAEMKVFFDRLSDLLSIRKEKGRELRGKYCSVLSTGVADYPPDCFEDVFKITADYLGMNHLGMFYSKCPEYFERDVHDKSLTEYTKQLVI